MEKRPAIQTHHQSMLQSSTEEAAVDMAAFVAIFFEHFKRFTGKPFHMAGESYGVGCTASWC